MAWTAEYRRAYLKAYYQKNKEKHAAYGAAQYQRDKEKIALKTANRSAEEIEKDREYDKKWNAKNYEKNKESILAQSRAWVIKNPDKDKATRKKRRLTPKGKALSTVSRHARRAAGKIPVDIMLQLQATRVCYYCGVGIDSKIPGVHACKTTVEHKHPISRGGTNAADNLVAACYACNASKGDKTEAEFRRDTVKRVKFERKQPRETPAWP